MNDYYFRIDSNLGRFYAYCVDGTHIGASSKVKHFLEDTPRSLGIEFKFTLTNLKRLPHVAQDNMLTWFADSPSPMTGRDWWYAMGMKEKYDRMHADLIEEVLGGKTT